MSRLLERLKREKAEKEMRRLERERKRKEREAEKKKEKRERRKKLLKKRANRRAYVKRRKAELKKRERMGDVFGYYRILIMKNNKKLKSVGHAYWRINAMEKYHDLIAKNREEVKFPAHIYETNQKKQKEAKRSQKVKFEIMVLERISEEENNVSHFRDDNGKFVEYAIKDDKSYKIIAHDEWYVEETFNVYGYNPYKDRKDYSFILNEMILKQGEHDDIKRIFHFNHRLIIQNDNDIDIITCKTPKEAERLHDALKKSCEGKQNLFFTGKLRRTRSSWILNEMEKKTGWTRSTCQKVHTL